MVGDVGELGCGKDHLGPALFKGCSGCESPPREIGLADDQVNAPETSLLITEPYFNLPNIAETYDQMVFEEWEFQSYYRCTRKSTLLPAD